MGKASVFRQYQYNPELQASEDYDLWARMATGGIVFANLPYALVKYRLHPAQASKTKARLLHDTSKIVCTNYTLAYLGNHIITEFSKAAETTLDDFRKFVEELSATCKSKSRDMNIFRPLIALQYRKLDRFGINAYVTLKRMSAKYNLHFPAKYLLNICLLSIFPIKRNSSLFDTLTKLKL